MVLTRYSLMSEAGNGTLSTKTFITTAGPLVSDVADADDAVDCVADDERLRDGGGVLQCPRGQPSRVGELVGDAADDDIADDRRAPAGRPPLDGDPVAELTAEYQRVQVRRVGERVDGDLREPQFRLGSGGADVFPVSGGLPVIIGDHRFLVIDDGPVFCLACR